MTDKNLKRLSASSAIGAGFGIIASSIIIMAMALVLTIGDIPAMVISPMTVAILALGGFCGGFLGAKLSGEKGLLCGALSGTIFFAVAWSIGGILGNGGFGLAAVIKAVMIIIASSLGGIIGVNYIKK